MLHVHAPQPDLRSVQTGTCLDCGKRTRFIGLCTPWYGWRTTCLRCGRTWCDGEWTPLDFIRGARKKSIASAKRSYRRAIPCTELLSNVAAPAALAAQVEGESSREEHLPSPPPGSEAEG